MKSLAGKCLILACLLMLTGCATSARHPQDPFENYNRAMFSFNDKVDEIALKPAAEAYQKVTPDVVQAGVGNFFGNIGDVWTAINNFLQGKAAEGWNDTARVTINSTVGLVGLIDVASMVKLPKHREDFGQTLGRWGINPGPYIVLPIIGSSTLRDTVALPVDLNADLWRYADPVRLRNAGIAVRVLDQRAALLDASDLLEAAALDRYEFIRDGYLQRRENKVFDDGDIPRKNDDVKEKAGE